MKKDMRFKLEKERNYDFQVMGFEFEKKEINRAVRFLEQYDYTNAVFPLIDHKIDKKKALAMLSSAGIEVPMMYKLGYHNNNCLGCCKGGMGYWNKIRVDFPEVFEKMAKLEREIGASCLKEKDKETGKSKKLFLDELDPNRGRKEAPITAECGILCAVEFADIISNDTEEHMVNGNVIQTLENKVKELVDKKISLSLT